MKWACYIDILIYWYIDMYGKIAKIKDVIGCTPGLRGKALQHSFHETWCRVQHCCAATISFSLPESESEMKQLLFCRNESGALCNYFFLLFIFTPNQFLFFSLQLSTILAVHCAAISFLFSLSLFTQSNDFFSALSLSPQTIISSFNSTFQDNNKRTNNSVLPYTMYFSKKRKYLHGWEIHFSILWQFEAQRIRSQKIHKGERNQLFCLILSVSPKTFCSCFFSTVNHWIQLKKIQTDTILSDVVRDKYEEYPLCPFSWWWAIIVQLPPGFS